MTSWSLIDWDDIKDRDGLILARMLQLDEQTLELSQATENLRNSRKANKVYFNQTRALRPDGDQQLWCGDLVLLHYSTKFQTGKPLCIAKLDDRWLGPYRILEVAENSTFYMLEELDGTPLAATIAGDRLKKFFTRDQLRYDRVEQLELLQSRSSNPARLSERLGMIDDAQNAGINKNNDSMKDDDQGSKNRDVE